MATVMIPLLGCVARTFLVDRAVQRRGTIYSRKVAIKEYLTVSSTSIYRNVRRVVFGRTTNDATYGRKRALIA